MRQKWYKCHGFAQRARIWCVCDCADFELQPLDSASYSHALRLRIFLGCVVRVVIGWNWTTARRGCKFTAAPAIPQCRSNSTYFMRSLAKSGEEEIYEQLEELSVTECRVIGFHFARNSSEFINYYIIHVYYTWFEFDSDKLTQFSSSIPNGISSLL